MKLAYALVVAALLSGCGKINLKCGTLEDCGGTCVDLQSDNNHCGSCTNVCSAGQACMGGACGGCPAGTKACGGTCIDTAVDDNNCGDCGTVCSGGMKCNAGTCACVSPLSVCNSTCVDTKTDATNCGGCGTVCDTGKSCVNGSCACVAPNLTCGSSCIDPATNSSNCNGCGNVCMGGKTCQASNCACVAPQTECSGSCFSTQSDRNHCGAGCSVCTATQVCNNGCTPAPAPGIVAKPSDPTGWKDSANVDIAFTFAATGIPGTIHECRTGPEATFTPSFPIWTNCDGATGANPTHKPAPTPGTPEGSYRTEYRYRADTYTSPVLFHQYYVHNSLNAVPQCPRAGMPADGPKFTDAQYFAAAQAVSTMSPTLFPTSSQFGFPSSPPLRTDSTYLRNPFIKITFVGVQRSKGMSSLGPVGSPWPAPGGTYVMNELSLRHRYVMNPGRTMILMKRSYINPKKNDCKNTFLFGSPSGDFIGPVVPTTTRGGKRRIECEAFVVNVRGDGVCLGGSGATPAAIPMDAFFGAVGTAQAGTITLNQLSQTVTGSGTAFTAAMVGQHIQETTVAEPFWYTIKTVTNATTLGLEQFPFNGRVAVAWKLANNSQLTQALTTPTGYAKFHTMPHAEAVGFRAPGIPSSNTKCTVPGCNSPTTGNPLLLFLPP